MNCSCVMCLFNIEDEYTVYKGNNKITELRNNITKGKAKLISI